MNPMSMPSANYEKIACGNEETEIFLSKEDCREILLIGEVILEHCIKNQKRVEDYIYKKTNETTTIIINDIIETSKRTKIREGISEFSKNLLSFARKALEQDFRMENYKYHLSNGGLYTL